MNDDFEDSDNPQFAAEDLKKLHLGIFFSEFRNLIIIVIKMTTKL